MNKIFKKSLLLFFAVFLIFGDLYSLGYVVAQTHENKNVDSTVVEEIDTIEEMNEGELLNNNKEEPEELENSVEENENTIVGEEEIQIEETEQEEINPSEFTSIDESKEKYEVELFFHIEKDDISKIHGA